VVLQILLQLHLMLSAMNEVASVSQGASPLTGNQPPLQEATGFEGVRLRTACDRCHSQKLRCPKPTGAEKCDRCRKARAPCEFSPFRQKKEQNERGVETDKSSLQAQLASLEDRISMATEKSHSIIGAKRKRVGSVEKPEHPADGSSESSTTESSFFQLDQIISSTEITAGANWSEYSLSLFDNSWPDHTFEDMDFGTWGQLPPATDLENHRNKTAFQLRDSPQSSPMRFFEPTSANTQPDPPVVPPRFPPKQSVPECAVNNLISTVHPKSEKHLVHQLSQLSVNLYGHIATIPPQSIHDTLPDGARPEAHTGYSVDQTFQLTQDLIDIYPVFIDTFLKKSSPESSASDKSFDTPNTQSSTTYEDLICLPSPLHVAAKPARPTSHDHASVLLLLSCHIRIIDIYDEIFVHMARCAEDNMGPFEPVSQQCQMYAPPAVKLGNFTPPPSSAVPMMMLLLVQQASQLSENAAELANHLRGPLPEELNGQKERDDAAILSLVTAEKVKGRASFMSQQLSAMRTKILSQGFLA
jgi:hypothetical protein